MLTWLTRKMRWRAAAVLAVLYAVCIVAPSVSLALADGSAAAHCLTDDHHSVAKSPAHHEQGADSAMQGYAEANASVPETEEGRSAPDTCCGMFCVTAFPAANHLPLGQMMHSSPLRSVIHDHLASRSPDRINRPPIASLSL